MRLSLDKLKKKSEISAERFTEEYVPIEYEPVCAEILGLTRLRPIIQRASYNGVQAMSGLLSVAVLRLLQGGTKARFRICPVRSDQEPLGAIRSFQRIEHR